MDTHNLTISYTDTRAGTQLSRLVIISEEDVVSWRFLNQSRRGTVAELMHSLGFVLICARVSSTGNPEREPVKQQRLIRTVSGCVLPAVGARLLENHMAFSNPPWGPKRYKGTARGNAVQLSID